MHPDQGCKFSGDLIFPEISRNISNSLEVIMSIIFIQRSGELFVENMLILQHHFMMLDLETAD